MEWISASRMETPITLLESVQWGLVSRSGGSNQISVIDETTLLESMQRTLVDNFI